ncbi:sugar ABC transporter permease [Haloarcula sp. Atlit-47R]|uniref:carbohydrate ABC transporter permease n=1 Tax=Haloarcula sp. Atlit-47R TaxID=2282132 RepID=UPI000EF19D2C|nr:sugar ABC transporter permease [Haloarcula sp. Atlit-47R]RLM42481.1 sugar ABC transporter permease [Haloarcula sp. Atlit-47R]
MSTETGRESRRSGALVSMMRWMENLSDTQYAYLLLIPVFVLLGVVALYPLLRTFELSLFALSADFSSTTFVGAGNYIELFTGEKNRFLPGGTTFLPEGLGMSALLNSALVVTIIFAVVSVLFETLIGLGQALILDQDFYGRRWIRAAIIIPWAVPIVIQGMIFFLMFNSNVGFLTPPLADLGLLAPTNTLNDTPSATFIIIVADIWKTSAFMALLILAGLQSIDRGLYDVARVAGATKWQQFKLITFPLILPTIGVAVLFRSVQAMRVYGIIDTVSSCTVVPSLSCMVVATFTTREGTSAAIAFVTAAIIGTVVMGLIVWQGEDAI